MKSHYSSLNWSWLRRRSPTVRTSEPEKLGIVRGNLPFQCPWEIQRFVKLLFGEMAGDLISMVYHVMG